jgi:tetratricopeptide (TPR) repeat protein
MKKRLNSPEPPAEAAPAPSTKVEVTAERGVGIGRDVSDSNIATGDNAIIAEQGSVVTRIDHSTIVMQAAPPIVTSLHQLPSPSPDFTDREPEMAQLREQLQGGVNTYVLWGMGGVGKSDLAFKLADELRQHFADGEIHLNLRGTSKPPLSVAAIMTHVIHSYNQAAELPKDDEGLTGMYRSVLYGKRALLLMDNAGNAEQVEPLLHPDCAMVITSRQLLVLPEMFDMSVNPLPPEDARALLMKITKRVSEEQADKIAKLCGYLPLALKVAARAIKSRRDLSVEDYVRRLGAAHERLDLVEASLNLSYELLSPEQQKLFSALAAFPGSFDVKAAAALWTLPPDRAQDAVSDLVAFSLVDWNDATSRYRLQELVRIFADARLSDDERAAYRKWHSFYFLNKLGEAGELYSRGGAEAEQGMKLFDAEWANIQAAQEWAKNHIAEDAVAAAVSDSYSYTGASLLAVRRLPQERIGWHEAAAAAARQTQKRSVEGANLCFVGVAYRDLGDYDKTIEYCQRALDIAREEKDPHEESRALSYIGIAHYYQGDYEEAVGRCKDALDITRRTGGDKRIEIEQLRYLGHARRGLGQFEEAVEAYRQSLEAARQSGDRNGENYVLSALGRISSDMGKHERAIKEYLPDAIRVAGEIGDRRGESASLGHLGLAYREMGQYEEAKACYEQALKVASAIGEQSVEAYSLGGLGRVYLALGQLEAAIESASAALEIANKIEMQRAQQHWGTILAQIYLHADRELPKALQILDDALAYNSIWTNHRSFATKGLVLARLGQAQPAREAFLKASEHARRLLERTPGYFDTGYILGLATCGMSLTAGEEEKARLMAEAGDAYEKAYSNCSSPGVVSDALDLLGELLRVDEAADLRRVYDLLKSRAAAGPA